jgi:hypothetical protein
MYAKRVNGKDITGSSKQINGFILLIMKFRVCKLLPIYYRESLISILVNGQI